MKVLLASLLLFFSTCAVYYGGANLSHLFFDVSLALACMAVVCWFCFLLGIAVAVIGATDMNGRLHAPKSITRLLGWMLLIPHGGLAIGLLVNYQSTLAIMLAASESTGASVRFLGDGMALLEGKIGPVTLDSLLEEHRRNQIELLELRSEGGLIDSAIGVGAVLRSNGIAIFVERHCASACVIVALSGRTLYVTSDAQFGFHRGSAIASAESQWGKFIAKAATGDLIAELRNLGVPDPILTTTEQTPPEAMHWVSGAELYRMGLAQQLVE